MKKIHIILVLSLFATLAYAFVFRIHPVVDAKAYDRIAQNILAGNGFVEDAGVPTERDNAIIRVGPLYQYFLAGVYAVFGHRYEAVWVIQALLHVLTAYVVYLIGRIGLIGRMGRMGGDDTVALIAAGIVAFYPDLIEISAMLMTETLYLFLWSLFVFLFLRYVRQTSVGRGDVFRRWLGSLSDLLRTRQGLNREKREWPYIFLFGLITGLAVLARPPILFVLPIVIYFFLHRRRLDLLALYALMMVMVWTPWTVRNYLTYDRIMPFGGAGNYNFWIGNHPGANGEQETGQEIAQYLTDHGALALYDASVPGFVSFVRHQPFQFVKLTLLRVNHYFSIIRPMGFWFYDSGWSQAVFVASSALASALLFVFALYGIIRAWREREPTLSYLVMLAVLTPFILFVTVVETRYRFQIYPLLAVLAGFGLVDFVKEMGWKKRSFAMAVAVVLLNGGIDAVLSWQTVVQRMATWL